MPQAKANGIEIEYVTEGDPSDPALLLVMGLGAQLTTWPDGFVDGLRQRGFFVIRYDNRDSGLSTKFDGVPDIMALFTGTDLSSAPYRIEDMADDGAALLAALGIAKAHVVGASLGGMISREEAIQASVEGSLAIGSPGYPIDEGVRRERAAAAYDRSYCPDGTVRQLAAILASPDRTEGLRGVDMPFLVMHGEADPLVTPSGGHATAAAVPGSRLLTFPGMGHDLPEPLWGTMTDAIVANTELAAV